MSLKLGLNLTRYYSINFDLPKRNKKKIIYIVLHYTGMKKETQAIKRLYDSKSKVSSHYFIKNNGKVLTLIPDLYIPLLDGLEEEIHPIGGLESLQRDLEV